MAEVAFSCSCGQVEGIVDTVPRGGLHLACHCDSCRAGALYCGADLAPETPVDLYLTPPHHVRITKGIDRLEPFVFSPRGILRWKATCCGVQMFSSQRNPRNAFMSVRTDRLTTPEAIGPILTWSFVPGETGAKAHKGKRALAGLVFKAARARMSGRWRKTPLYTAYNGKPIAEPVLVPQAEKSALLGRT